MIRLVPTITLATLTLFSCQKESKSEEPVVPPAKVPATLAKVSIASVTMLEDCPDPEPLPEAKRAVPVEEEREASMDSDGSYDMPCSQSTMQLSITGQRDGSSKLAIKEVRLLGPKGDTLDTLNTRMPTVWKEDGYATWDEMVMPGNDLKASYKLSLPNWNETEKKLGGSSYGPAFLLEADIEVGGVVQTMQSSQVVREPVEMIET